MNEVGIDTSQQTSDLIDLNILNEATLVVTLCCDAKDNCPVIPPHVHHEHWGFDNPPRATGTDTDKWTILQRVRDVIGAKLENFSKVNTF